MEAIGGADQSVAAAWNAHSTIASLPLAAFGTEEQKQRWLRTARDRSTDSARSG